MKDNEVLSKAAKEIVQDSDLTVSIDIKPKNKLHHVLIKLKILPSKKNYPITPILVGNRLRIASRAVLFPKNIWEEGLMKALWSLSKDHNEDLIYMAGVIIQNNRKEPSNELLEELRWIEDETLFTILDKGLSKMDINSFMKSTILIIGTEMMREKEMGQELPEEIIAPGEQ